jgi:hypothetical protein
VFKKIRCVIGDILINKTIPDKILNKKVFKNLPEDNIGRCEPIMYGRFDLTEEMNEDYDLAPAIMIDSCENIFLASNHKIYDSSHNYYIYNSTIDRYVRIISDVEFINYDKAIIHPDWIIECEAVFKLKKRGSLTSNSLIERYFNYLNGGNSLLILSGESLFLASDEISDCGYIDYYFNGSEFGTVKLIISTGNVVNGNNNYAAKVKYYLNGQMYYNSSNTISNLDSNTNKEIILDVPMDNFFKIAKSIQFGIDVEQNASVEFKKMCCCIKFIRK